MPESEIAASIFRFVALRPPETVDSDAVLHLQHLSPASTFLLSLHAARDGEHPWPQMVARAREFIASPEFVGDADELSPGLGALWQRLRTDPDADFARLEGLVREVFGNDAGALTATETWRDVRQRVADSVVALEIAPEGRGLHRTRLIRSLRLIAIVERVAASDQQLNAAGAVAEALARIVVLPEGLLPAPRRPEPASPSEEPGRSDRRPEAERRRLRRLENMEAAWSEVARVSTYSGRADSRARPDFDVRLPDSMPDDDEREPLPRVPDEPHLAPEALPWLLPRESVERMSPETVRTLRELGIALESTPLPDIAGRLGRELALESAALLARRPPRTVLTVGATHVAIGPSEAAPLDPSGGAKPGVAPGSGALKPVGIADLMVVQQRILRYEMGEIAHIENVLKGESKERRHRRARKVEEQFMLESERAEETERDVQSTERFELEREAAQTIKEDMKLEAGLTVTAKYGPSVEVVANTDLAMENSKEETKRTATKYSRDVTERAASRLSERVREERVRRVTEEFEETNAHGVNNTSGTGHVVGVYRWVDKIYGAQVVNYGKRMMFEFVVPEPAAFLLHALTAAPVEGAALEKPDPPLAPGGQSALTPRDIMPWNYQTWVSQYQVSNVSPPPELFRISVFTYKTESTEKKWKDEAVADKIPIPDGYEPLSGHARIETFPGDYAFATLILGRTTRIRLIDWVASLDLALPEGAPVTDGLPVTIHVSHKWQATCAIEILCRLTERALAVWQFQTYEAIQTAYANLKSRYDEQLATRAVQRGIGIVGRNPDQNREIEKTELRRAALTLLIGQVAGQPLEMNAVVDDPLGYPQPDIAHAKAQGDYVQFFEQTFEWSQVSYVFYPYFWARKPRWPLLQQIADVDPLHARFLQAGAARVLVPVRPSYEAAILYFLQTQGVIWSGAGPPEVVDPQYVPLAQELKEQQGAGAEGVPVGEPWELKVPTSLVMLQPDATLPVWP